MPLLVTCPCGHEARMPSSRAGKVARCPECKSRIQISKPTKDELATKPIRVLAVFAKNSGADQTEDATSTSASDDLKAKPIVEIISLDKDESTPEIPFVPPTVADPNALTREDALNLEHELYRDSSGVETLLSQKLESEKAAQETEEADDGIAGLPMMEPVPQIDVNAKPKQVGVKKDTSLGHRAKSAQDDRVVLSRFFAICLCGIAVVNVLPSFYFWQQGMGLGTGDPQTALPRWMYLQIFIAGIYLIYAVFLAQVPDWASLRAVSIAMLAVAMVFGLISTGILIGGAEGAVARFLALGDSQIVRQASIWCVAMLCLATLMSYLGGRESARWQRAEQLLGEIGGKGGVKSA